MMSPSGLDQLPASRGQVPASEGAPRTSAISGLNGSASFENAVRLLSSENKLPVRTAIAGLTQSPLTLRRSATVFPQTKFQLRQLEHRTADNASTLLQYSSTDKRCSKGSLVLEAILREWKEL
jgi:hypothetical protein